MHVEWNVLKSPKIKLVSQRQTSSVIMMTTIMTLVLLEERGNPPKVQVINILSSATRQIFTGS